MQTQRDLFCFDPTNRQLNALLTGVWPDTPRLRTGRCRVRQTIRAILQAAWCAAPFAPSQLVTAPE